MGESFVDGIGSHADLVAAARRSESCRVIPEGAQKRADAAPDRAGSARPFPLQ